MPNIILVRAMFDDTKSEVKIKGKEAGSLNDFLPPKGQINSTCLSSNELNLARKIIFDLNFVVYGRA